LRCGREGKVELWRQVEVQVEVFVDCVLRCG